jgi:hypothetical protein
VAIIGVPLILLLFCYCCNRKSSEPKKLSLHSKDAEGYYDKKKEEDEWESYYSEDLSIVPVPQKSRSKSDFEIDSDALNKIVKQDTSQNSNPYTSSPVPSPQLSSKHNSKRIIQLDNEVKEQAPLNSVLITPASRLNI